MSYIDELNSVFILHGIAQEAQAEIRHIFARVVRDAERQGFSEGWNEGQSHCDLER